MHDWKHLNVLNILQLVTPTLRGTEKILKLALRHQFLLRLASELQNSDFIQHRWHFVSNIVLKLLDAFFALVLKSSEVEVGVISFVLFYLVAQV